MLKLPLPHRLQADSKYWSAKVSALTFLKARDCILPLQRLLRLWFLEQRGLHLVDKFPNLLSIGD